MAENTVNEATRNLIQSLRESNQAIVDSAVGAQERNAKFAQSVFENGIEVLKSHVESTRSLMQEVGPKQQEVFQKVVDSAVAAQERNIQFAQGVFENGIEVLKSHAESTRSLTHTLLEQVQVQREAFRTLSQESVEAYGKFFTSPTSYLERALEFTETVTRQGVESYQKVAQQAREKSQATA
jgi:Phasin protein